MRLHVKRKDPMKERRHGTPWLLAPQDRHTLSWEEFGLPFEHADFGEEPDHGIRLNLHVGDLTDPLISEVSLWKTPPR